MNILFLKATFEKMEIKANLTAPYYSRNYCIDPQDSNWSFSWSNIHQDHSTHCFFTLFIFYAERLSSLRGCRFLCTVITNDKCRP